MSQLVSQVNGGGLVGSLLDLFIFSILEGVAWIHKPDSGYSTVLGQDTIVK